MNYKNVLAAAAAGLGLLALAVPASAAEASTTTTTVVPMSTTSTGHNGDVTLVVTHTGHFVDKVDVKAANAPGLVHFEYTDPNGTPVRADGDCHPGGPIPECDETWDVNQDYPGGVVTGSATYNGKNLGTAKVTF